MPEDQGPGFGVGDCPNCGPKTLATVKIRDGVYTASCTQCDHETQKPIKEADDA